MPAKSVAGLSRASRSTVNENQSVSRKTSIETDKMKLSPLAKEKMEKFQDIMGNAKVIFNNLFLDDQTKAQVDEAHTISFQIGVDIIKHGYRNLTDEDSSDFFNKWTELLDILENYFDFNPDERYTQFIDELTQKIIRLVQPLGELIFDENYPNGAKKAKKQAQSEKESFDNTMTILSKQTYKYFKGRLSVGTFTQTIKQLISSITSHDNLYFHQPREDAKEILFQTQSHLHRILDAVLDYNADEKSIEDCNNQLSKVSKNLRLFFKGKKKKELNTDLKLDNSYSDNDYEEDQQDIRSRKRRSSTNKDNDNSQKRQISNDNNDLRRIKNKGYKATNAQESEEQLKMEILDLKREIKRINKKISAQANQEIDINEDTDLQTKISDLSFKNDYLKQVIKHKKEFNEEIKKDLASFNTFNSELKDDSFSTPKYTQKLNASTRKLNREIVDLKDDLQVFTDELEKYRQLTSQSSQIQPKRSNKADIKRALIELKEQKKAFQNSIDDMEEIEEELTNQEREMATHENPYNQVLLDILTFVEDHRSEAQEIENKLKNSDPIQKVKKIPKELEEYRNDKFVSDIDSEFLNTREKLEETRGKFDSCFSKLNDTFDELLEVLSQETEETTELFQNELSDEENLNYLISHDDYCRFVDDTTTHDLLENRMKMIDEWLIEKCPKYNELDILTEEKLKLLLESVESNDDLDQY